MCHLSFFPNLFVSKAVTETCVFVMQVKVQCYNSASALPKSPRWEASSNLTEDAVVTLWVRNFDMIESVQVRTGRLKGRFWTFNKINW